MTVNYVEDGVVEMPKPPEIVTIYSGINDQILMVEDVAYVKKLHFQSGKVSFYARFMFV